MYFNDLPMGDLEINLHRSKLNYSRLSSALNKLIYSNLLDDKDTINIFIDLWDVVKPFYKPDMIEKIKNIDIFDRYMLVSEIINIAGHYKHYFWSRLNKYSNIYFFYSNEESEYCKSINPEFRIDFYNKRFRFSNDENIHNVKIMNTFNMVDWICTRLPHVYCINTGSLEFTSLPKLVIDNSNSNEYNLIIAQSDLYYQCINGRYDVGILHCKGDRSTLVHLDNLYDVILSKTKSGYNGNLSNELYPLVRALSGVRELSIKSGNRMGVAKAVDKVQKLLDSNTLQRNIEYDPDTLMLLLDDKEIVDRFKMISHRNIINNIKRDEYVKIFNQTIDKTDIESLKAVCNKYFKKNEIRLDFLFEGETV